jgi:hypothetical protein
MKRELREEMRKAQEGKFKAFADEYLTTKNVLMGVGVASLAGIATYSTVKALKNEKLVNKIKKELNFDNIKKNISKLGEMGGKAEGIIPQKKGGRKPVSSSRKSPGSRARKRTT